MGAKRKMHSIYANSQLLISTAETVTDLQGFQRGGKKNKFYLLSALNFFWNLVIHPVVEPLGIQ